MVEMERVPMQILLSLKLQVADELLAVLRPECILKKVLGAKWTSCRRRSVSTESTLRDCWNVNCDTGDSRCETGGGAEREKVSNGGVSAALDKSLTVSRGEPVGVRRKVATACSNRKLSFAQIDDLAFEKKCEEEMSNKNRHFTPMKNYCSQL